MAGLHNTIAAQLAANALTVTGMKGSSATPVDQIPDIPYTVVGPPAGQLLQPGSWERLLIAFPMRTYVARVDDSKRVQATVNDFLDVFLSTFRLGITLGGNVTEAVLRTWNTNVFYTLNGEEFQVIDWQVAVEVERAAGYTA
jgi:hypothetical protein